MQYTQQLSLTQKIHLFSLHLISHLSRYFCQMQCNFTFALSFPFENGFSIIFYSIQHAFLLLWTKICRYGIIILIYSIILYILYWVKEHNSITRTSANSSDCNFSYVLLTEQKKTFKKTLKENEKNEWQRYKKWWHVKWWNFLFKLFIHKTRGND